MVIATTTFAAPLTPDQALNAARGNTVASGKIKAKAADMKLSYTLDGSHGPTLYIFTPTAADAKGFVIAAADDSVTPLLGYSDTDSFDAANIPPQMQWLLDSYSRDIEFIVSNPDKASKMKLAALAASENTEILINLRNSTHAAIAPLCATKWNQGSPYNDECPMVENGRSVTGCYDKTYTIIATMTSRRVETNNAPLRANGTVNGKVSFNLNDTRVKEYGVSINEGVLTGINDITDVAEVESVLYVDMKGQLSINPFEGVNLVVTRYSDGTKSVTKLIK